jgi:hypothetical protein
MGAGNTRDANQTLRSQQQQLVQRLAEPAELAGTISLALSALA